MDASRILTVALAVALGSASFLASADQSGPVERLKAVSNLAGSGSEVLPDVADHQCNLVTALNHPDTAHYQVELTTSLGLHLGLGGCDPQTDLTPLRDPSGNPITLGDWKQATGHASIECVEGGTRYHFRFKGLIPNGLYTLWHFPGSGGGALASHRPNDINNVMTANVAGNAHLIVVGTAGNMTFGGSVGACTLPTSENIGRGYDFVGGFGDALFMLEYHNDQRTHGPFPGPFNTFAAPLAFVLDSE